MKEYWEGRYQDDQQIWGSSPSRTALDAVDKFKKHNVRNLLIPGAGYGRNAKAFIDTGMKVAAIEVAPSAIAIGENFVPELQYFIGSVLDMPFSNDMYDAVYCFNVLHFFFRNERQLFLQKCFDQMQPGGVAFFAVFSEKEPSYGKGKEVEKNTFETKPGRPVHYFSADDLEEHFGMFNILETGLMEDPEKHDQEGEHIHIVRYIYVKK